MMKMGKLLNLLERIIKSTGANIGSSQITGIIKKV